MSIKSSETFAEQIEYIANEGKGKSEKVRILFEKLEKEIGRAMAVIAE